jgi:hypothetical protein
MDDPSGSRSTLERWIALLVRYWAYNMTLAFRSGGYYPGFGYSDDEKAEMASLSQKCSFGQFVVWAFVVALVVIPVIAVTSVPGMYYVIVKAGATLPASIFFLSMGVTIVGCFTIGLPVAMLLSSALVGRWYGVADPDLPDRATTARFFHKLWFQLTRMALVMMAILVPVWIFVPGDSKIWVTLRVVMPFLGPAAAVITCAYYLSLHLNKQVDR